MAGNTVESVVDLVLRDDVTASSERIAASFRKMEAAEKAMGQAFSGSNASSKMQNAMKQIGAQVPHVHQATKALEEYARAQNLPSRRQDWSKQQIAGWRAEEQAAIARTRTILREDKLLAEGQQRLMAQQQRTVAAHHQAMERNGFGHYLLQSAAFGVSAHGIMSGIEKSVERGADYQSQMVQLQNAGRTSAEIKEMQTAMLSTARAAPTSTLTESLETLKETTSAFGSVEHAIEHLAFMTKSSAVLHAATGGKITDSTGEMGNKLARFFEMRGTAGDPKVFEHEASEMMRSMVFSGGNVNPSELLNFAQQAKSSLQNYDLPFLSRVAPSLIGEVGGERAGTQANAFNSVILGKVNDRKQAEAWLKYKLVDPSKVEMKGGHAVGWTGGAVYNTDLALRNPLAFGEDWLLKQLEAGGVKTDDRLELTKVLGTLYRNTNANAFANELWQRQNRNRLHKDAHLIGEVDDPESMYQRLLKTDPKVAFQALTSSLSNLMTVVSSPGMSTAAGMMSSLASGLNDVAAFGARHPGTALTAGLATAGGALYGAGRIGYGLMNGFGLTTAAGALEGSAVAIDAAAGRLGVAAIEHGVPSVIPGKVGRAGAAIAAAEEGVAIGALEATVTGAASLSVGTLALGALAGAVVLKAIQESMSPKARASDRPGYGSPYAPGAAFDPQTGAELPKPAVGTPRGSVKSQVDGTGYGKWVIGRGGQRQWVAFDVRPRAQPFFVGKTGPDGRPLGDMPFGYWPDRGDKRTWPHIDFGMPMPNPNLYQPGNVPIPPSRPADPFRHPAWPHTPTPRFKPFSDAWLTGERNAIDLRSQINAVDYHRDPEAARGRQMMQRFGAMPTEIHAKVEVDTSGLDAAIAKAEKLASIVGSIRGSVSVNVPSPVIQASSKSSGKFRPLTPVQTGRISV